MKVAICFSGAIRSFKYCYPSIYKYLIESLNADVFLHVWTIPEIDKTQKVTYKFVEDSCDVNYIIQQIKPKKYVVDEYNSTWEERLLKESKLHDADFTKIPDIYKKHCKNDKDAYIKYVHNAIGMYYKIMKCNELKSEYENKHNFKYDIVIRARLDFVWNKFVNIKNVLDNTIYTINDSYCSQFEIPNNDRFFYGNSNTMDRFCNIFKNLKSMHEKDVPIQGSDLWKAELVKYNYDRIGDLDYYYKFINGFHLPVLKDINIYITITNNLMYSISEQFLKQGYNVFNYCPEKQYISKLKEYENFYDRENKSFTIDYYVIDDTFNEYDNINIDKTFLISKEKYRKNTNTILIKCKIIEENNEIKKINDNECYLPELSYFISLFIEYKTNKSITIEGSCPLILYKDDIIYYNIWGVQNKIWCYMKYKVNEENELICIDRKKNIYKIKNTDVIQNYYSKYILRTNTDHFKNNKIESMYI